MAYYDFAPGLDNAPERASEILETAANDHKPGVTSDQAPKEAATPHEIVIVGGGAAGLELATGLGNTLARRRRARIMLVDKARAHLWKPLLYSVAAGSLDFDEDALDYLAHCFGEMIAIAHTSKSDLRRHMMRRALRSPQRDHYTMIYWTSRSAASRTIFGLATSRRGRRLPIKRPRISSSSSLGGSGKNR
jgi:hypothetical protein